ncbi:oxygenase MpaB family protein [Quadrisphaera sp. DSM 44207]|uniref:oxygenase MpaB family protein n=1 Tax=Quadrisphaera sp. DSM 44207 TaxID=1881057 RepID=UPI0015A1BBAB|nr:oxygenase MpaB family protein [Quadrisphaera sp. DSM 44207]
MSARSTPDVPGGGEALPRLLAPDHLARAEAVYQDLVTVRFGFEARLGHVLAYLRTYASPSIAGLLAHTGHVQHAPEKRATDTGLFVYELFVAGLDSPTGDQVVRRLAAMHSRWRIADDDYTWVLGTFAVLGTRVIERCARRRLTDDERQATVDWWREFGTRMGVVDVPATYAEFADAFDDYERRRLRRTEEGQALLAASWPALVAGLPAPARPLARQLVGVLTDEPARSALGLPRPDPATRAAVTTALRARALLQRGRGTGLGFTPGAPIGPYRDGYTLDDLGVGDDHRHPMAR